MLGRFSLGAALAFLAMSLLGVATCTQCMTLALLGGSSVVWIQMRSFSRFTACIRGDEDEGSLSSFGRS